MSLNDNIFNWSDKYDRETGAYRTRCYRRHVRRETGEWKQGDNDSYGIVIQHNGVVQLKARCRDCGKAVGPLPHAIGVQWKVWDRLEWCKRNERAWDYPPCSYYGCPEDGVDDHHFAPRNTFGLDADNWPCLPLCKKHHVEWHQRMDGYSRTRKYDDVDRPELYAVTDRLLNEGFARALDEKSS